MKEWIFYQYHPPYLFAINHVNILLYSIHDGTYFDTLPFFSILSLHIKPSFALDISIQVHRNWILFSYKHTSILYHKKKYNIISRPCLVLHDFLYEIVLIKKKKIKEILVFSYDTNCSLKKIHTIPMIQFQINFVFFLHMYKDFFLFRSGDLLSIFHMKLQTFRFLCFKEYVCHKNLLYHTHTLSYKKILYLLDLDTQQSYTICSINGILHSFFDPTYHTLLLQDGTYSYLIYYDKIVFQILGDVFYVHPKYFHISHYFFQKRYQKPNLDVFPKDVAQIIWEYHDFSDVMNPRGYETNVEMA